MPRTRIALSLAAALFAGFAAPQAGAASRTEYDPAEWVLCRPNALYEFYRPNLGLASDRENAETALHAESFDIHDQRDYVLSGDVEILRADQRVAAALMRYDPEREAWSAEGGVQYQDSGMLMEAERAHGELEKDRAELHSLRYQLLRMRGNGEALHAINEGDSSQLDGVFYTTCDPGNRQWMIRAEQLDIDQAEGTATARHATLRLGGVPLLYLLPPRHP